MTNRIQRKARADDAAREAPRDSSRKVKIAITLPQKQVAAANRAVEEGRAPSVSAYIAQALERQAEAEALSELVALMRAEDGPPSPEDYAWADSALGLTRGGRRRARG